MNLAALARYALHLVGVRSCDACGQPISPLKRPVRIHGRDHHASCVCFRRTDRRASR